MRNHSGSGDTYNDSVYDGPNSNAAWSICGFFRGDGIANSATGWRYSFGNELSTLLVLSGGGEIIEVNLWFNRGANGNQLACYIDDGTTSADQFSGYDPITLGTDFRWCITYDGTNAMRAWVNGTEILFMEPGPYGPSTSGAVSFSALASGVELIADQDSACGDIAIWHRELTPAEAASATDLVTPTYSDTGLAFHREMQAAGENETVSGTNNETIAGGSWVTHTPVASLPSGPLTLTHSTPTDLLTAEATSAALQAALSLTHAAPTELVAPEASTVALQSALGLTHAAPTELVTAETTSVALGSALTLTHAAPTELVAPEASTLAIAGNLQITHAAPTELVEPQASSVALQVAQTLTHAVGELVTPEATSVALGSALAFTHPTPTELVAPETTVIALAGNLQIIVAPTDLLEAAASTIAIQAGQTLTHTAPTELVEPQAASFSLQAALSFTHPTPTELVEAAASSIASQAALVVAHTPTELVGTVLTFLSIGAPFSVQAPFDVYERETLTVQEREPLDVRDRTGETTILREAE